MKTTTRLTVLADQAPQPLSSSGTRQSHCPWHAGVQPPEALSQPRFTPWHARRRTTSRSTFTASFQVRKPAAIDDVDEETECISRNEAAAEQAFPFTPPLAPHLPVPSSMGRVPGPQPRARAALTPLHTSTQGGPSSVTHTSVAHVCDGNSAFLLLTGQMTPGVPGRTPSVARTADERCPSRHGAKDAWAEGGQQRPHPSGSPRLPLGGAL